MVRCFPARGKAVGPTIRVEQEPGSSRLTAMNGNRRRNLSVPLLKLLPRHCARVTITSHSLPLDEASSAATLIQNLTRYRRPSWVRASFELVLTVGLLIASWIAM